MFHYFSTLPLTQQKDTCCIVGGRDLASTESNGTWLGLNLANSRVSALTNIRRPGIVHPRPPYSFDGGSGENQLNKDINGPAVERCSMPYSRGYLVRDWLAYENDSDVAAFLEKLKDDPKSDLYNLLVGEFATDVPQFGFHTSGASKDDNTKTCMLSPDTVYAMSNSVFNHSGDSVWEKQIKGREAVQAILKKTVRANHLSMVFISIIQCHYN